MVTGRKGKLGVVYFVDVPYWPHDTSLWVKDFHGNDARFVKWLLLSLELERLDEASACPTLNRNNVHAIKVAIPRDRSEQKHIADMLEACLDAIDENASVLRHLDGLKAALMSVLLTGEQRLF